MSEHNDRCPQGGGFKPREALSIEWQNVLDALHTDPTNDLLRRKYLYLRYVRDGAWCARNPDELAQHAIDSALRGRP